MAYAFPAILSVLLSSLLFEGGRCASSIYPSVTEISGIHSAIAQKPKLVQDQKVALGSVTGQVGDGTGAVIPGVKVTVRSVESGVARIATTDGWGRYRIRGLPAGGYLVEAVMPGFIPETAELSLPDGGAEVLDLTLRVGEIEAGQQASDSEQEWTKEEARKVKEFGALFSQKMNESRDVLALLDDLFLPGLKRRLVKEFSGRDKLPGSDSAGFFLVGVSPQFASKASRRALVSYFVQTVNFWYFAGLHGWLRYLENPISDHPTFEEMLPVETVEALKKHPALASRFEGRSARKKWVCKNQGDLETIVDALENAVATMRRDDLSKVTVAKLNEESAARMKGNALDRVTVCPGGCSGLTQQRVIEMTVPPFLHLHMVEIDGRLKIVFIDIPTD